jgi:hypothetical protein
MKRDIKLSDYIKQFGCNWADILPKNCPPQQVLYSENDFFYRFTIEDNIVTDKDWVSYLLLFPERLFSGTSLVLASGLSIRDSLEDARNQFKLPFIKKHFKGVAQIALLPEDGVMIHSKKDLHHFTWWRTSTCDLSKARIV